MNSVIFKFIVASAAEVELGALFHICQGSIDSRQTLLDMSYPQPKTLVDCNNAMAVGIGNNTIKRQQLQYMEM
jgi:hypothetical protein